MPESSDVPINGITLHVERAGEGTPLLLLHGFTGSVATWRPFYDALTTVRQVIAVDILGHGLSESPEDAERYTQERTTEDILAVLDTLGIDTFDLLGYSMGGRVALHLAATAPQRVISLILESSTPGMRDAAERAARVIADGKLAAKIDNEGLEAFIKYWEQVPLFASQLSLPAEVRNRVRSGRLRSNPVGLANSLRGLGSGRQRPLWSDITTFPFPALIIAGTLDPKYTALAHSMAEKIPNAQLAIIQDAGHAVHLERPDLFEGTVLRFLQAHSTGNR